MKRTLIGLVSLIATAVISCTNEVDTINGSTSVVSFNVSTSEDVSRGFNDGSKATNLQYAVYNSAGELLPALTVTDDTIDNLQTTINLEVATGNTYHVMFWADNGNAPYTIDFANKTLCIDYTNANSNDDTFDAFYTYKTIFVEGKTMSVNAELRRPFAQLNIGSTDNITTSGITIEAYTLLNLETGAVSNPKMVTFAQTPVPQGETFPVSGYNHVAMNYLLIGTDKELFDVILSCKNGASEIQRTFTSVPLQRNYKTNVYGSIFSTNANSNVQSILIDFPTAD